MEEKVNVEELEELIKKYFSYMDELTNKIRQLKSKIKLDTEKLNKELEQDKKWKEMCLSLNIGKGNYHKVCMWPTELNDYMQSDEYKKLPNESKDAIKEEFKKAVEASKKVELEYTQLTQTRESREKNIKDYKKRIKTNKTELTKIEKEKRNHFLKIKQLDKKIKPYISNVENNNDIKQKELKYQKDEK